MRALVFLAVVACSSSHADQPDAPGAAIDAPAGPADAAGVAHRAFPQVTFGGGHLLTSMRLVVITAPSDTLASELAAFCTTLVTSQWWTTVAAPYGLGTPRGCV